MREADGATGLTLALETSTRLGSLAVGEDGELLVECALGVRAGHSETVLPEAERLLSRCGREPGELRRVVVGAGPGSFTGVRIAASLARGLCYGGACELYAYSSLAATAASCAAGQESPVCALFAARGREVYAAAVTGFRPLRYELDPSVLSLEELLERLEPGSWLFAGPGARAHRRAIVDVGGRVLPAFRGVPRAAALLWLAAADPTSGRVMEPEGWEPSYVRSPGATPSAPPDR